MSAVLDAPHAPPARSGAIERTRPAGPPARRASGTVAAMATVLAGAIHLGVVPAHLAVWAPEAIAFLATGTVQVAGGLALLSRRHRALARMLGMVHLAAVVAWMVTRTLGWPLGPMTGEVEPVAVAGVVAVAAELLALVAFRRMRPGRLPRPGRITGLASGLVLVAVVTPAVALVPGLAHDPADHDHGLGLAVDHGPDGLDPRRTPESPTAGTAVPVGDAPVDVAFGHGMLWAVNGRDGSVTRIDDGRVVDVVEGVGEGATTIVTGPDAVWVAAASAGTVTRLDAETGEVTGTVEVGGMAKGLAYGDGAVFATSALDGRIHRIDPATLEVTSARLQPDVLAYFSGPGPAAVAVAGDTAWVVLTLEGAVRAYDTDTLAPVGDPIETGDGPTDVLVAGGAVWVANTTSGTVTHYDAATGQQVGEEIVLDREPQAGGGPAALASAFGGIWVLNNEERTVTRIDADTGVVLGPPRFLSNVHAEVPRAAGIVGTGEAVWATDYDADRVVRLLP